MSSKHPFTFSLPFRSGLLLRIALIVLVAALTYYIWQQYYWLVAIWSTLIFGGLIVELVFFAEKRQRELRNFVLSIEQGDFSNHYPQQTIGTDRQELREAYRGILKKFQQLRSEKESHYRYLQTTVEQVRIGIISYNVSEEIILYNESARQLFRKPQLNRLQALDKVRADLPDMIRSLAHGQQEILKLETEGRLLSLSMQATEMQLLGEGHKLITFQDLTYQLEAQEAKSWHKLIRVLTHEITNSAIPLSTLSSLSYQMLADETGQPVDIRTLDEESVEDLRQSLRTIASRSKGLVNFVRAYKNLTEVSNLSLRKVDIGELLHRVENLLRPRLEQAGISLSTEINPNVSSLHVDLEMIEQVLINLILNAAEALEACPEPRIYLRCFRATSGQVQLEIIDNGIGMEPELAENAFIPFFTTKAKGSGIGLSLARQIMQLHKGSISLVSQPGKGTSLLLQF